MAKVIETLDDFVSYLNSLYEMNSSPPTSEDEDYAVWTSLANIAINLWESEEGILWNELFIKLEDASDGDKTTSASTYSYLCPTDFEFPASGYVWLGEGINKRPVKVIKQEELQLHEGQGGNWCYFLMDNTPTLEFNPNMEMPDGLTISYNYYKSAQKLVSGSDKFEMSDPMFAVYYALSELKKEEGDPTAGTLATQKLEGMKTKNQMPAWFMEDNLLNKVDEGFGL